MPYTKEQFSSLQKSDGKITKGDDCVTIFLHDQASNEDWVLKQVLNPDPEEQILLLFDYVCTIIANNNDIPIPEQSYLIPVDWIHKDKIFNDRIAMLQILATGKQCEDLTTQEHINIRQKNGLTIEILDNISKHQDLIKIAAFDTFVNNRDRSKPNLFYDQAGDHYCGIDHLAAFSNNEDTQLLSCMTTEFINKYSYHFTIEQQHTLTIYRDALQRLYDTFPPERIIKEINKALINFPSEYQLDKPNCKIIIQEKIIRRFDRIKANHSATKKLLAALNKSIQPSISIIHQYKEHQSDQLLLKDMTTESNQHSPFCANTAVVKPHL